jgi:hypothetical protein
MEGQNFKNNTFRKEAVKEIFLVHLRSVCNHFVESGDDFQLKGSPQFMDRAVAETDDKRRLTLANLYVDLRRQYFCVPSCIT